MQIADGMFRGLCVWWDAPEGLQAMMREAVEGGTETFRYNHTYWRGQEQMETTYLVDLAAMTCASLESGTTRYINVHARLMWTIPQ